MNARVIDLAPHEWCEVSSSSDIRPKKRLQDRNGWIFRCAVAVASAGVGFYISTASGARAPAMHTKHRPAPIVSLHAPASAGLRAQKRLAATRDWRKTSATSGIEAGAAEFEKTRWEMAGWTVRR